MSADYIGEGEQDKVKHTVLEHSVIMTNNKHNKIGICEIIGTLKETDCASNDSNVPQPKKLLRLNRPCSQKNFPFKLQYFYIGTLTRNEIHTQMIHDPSSKYYAEVLLIFGLLGNN